MTTDTAQHQPITILAGPQECLDRECEEYATEDGDDDPGVDHCSHIAEEQICGQCSTEQPDGEYEPAVPWADHTT